MIKLVRENVNDEVTLDDVYAVLGEYDGVWRSMKNGWEGKCEIYVRDLDDGYLFSLIWGDNTSEPDEIVYNTDKGTFAFFPYSGNMQKVSSLDELERILKKEYSYLRKIR